MNPSLVLGGLDFNSMSTTISLHTTRKVRYDHIVLGGVNKIHDQRIYIAL